MSSNVARIHLTDAHQMHVIHPNTVEVITLAATVVVSHRSTLFSRATRTDT